MTLRRGSESTLRASLGRRQLLRAGLASAVGFLTELALNGKPTFAFQAVANQAEGAPNHRIIDVHCHARWNGYNGARMIENMNAAGIGRAWLLSWEIPEREMDSYYYSEIDPTGIGMPFRDVIDVVERYPDRFIPGTTMDPRDPHAHERLKAAVNTYLEGLRIALRGQGVSVTVACPGFVETPMTAVKPLQNAARYSA